MKISALVLAVATVSLSGCKMFGSFFGSDSQVKGKVEGIGDQTGNSGCTTIKVLSGVEELGQWRMPHSDQGGDYVASPETADTVFDLKKITAMVVPLNNTSFVYLVNLPKDEKDQYVKMDDVKQKTENEKLDWLFRTPFAALKIEANPKPDDECDAKSSLLTWQGKQVGCFNPKKCTVIWIGDHKTGCELVVKDGQFSNKELFHCGELKARPGMQPAKP